MNNKVTYSMLIIGTVLTLFIINDVCGFVREVTPRSERQYMKLQLMSNCINYGFTDFNINYERMSKEPIIYDSLTRYTPLRMQGLVELEHFSSPCNVLYRREGFEMRDWIIIFRCRDFDSRTKGFWVLNFDGNIKRCRDIQLNSDVLVKCKFYYIKE